MTDPTRLVALHNRIFSISAVVGVSPSYRDMAGHQKLLILAILVALAHGLISLANKRSLAPSVFRFKNGVKLAVSTDKVNDASQDANDKGNNDDIRGFYIDPNDPAYERKKSALELLDILSCSNDPDAADYDVKKDIARNDLMRNTDYTDLKFQLKMRGLRNQGDKEEMLVRLLLHSVDPTISYSELTGREAQLSYISDEDVKSKRVKIVPESERNRYPSSPSTSTSQSAKDGLNAAAAAAAEDEDDDNVVVPGEFDFSTHNWLDGDENETPEDIFADNYRGIDAEDLQVLRPKTEDHRKKKCIPSSSNNRVEIGENNDDNDSDESGCRKCADGSCNEHQHHEHDNGDKDSRQSIMDGLNRQEIFYKPLQVRRSDKQVNIEDRRVDKDQTNDIQISMNSNKAQSDNHIKPFLAAYITGGRDVLKTWTSNPSIVILIPDLVSSDKYDGDHNLSQSQVASWRSRYIRILADELAFNQQCIVMVPDLTRGMLSLPLEYINIKNNNNNDNNSNTAPGTIYDSVSRRLFDDIMATHHYASTTYGTNAISLCGIASGATLAMEYTADAYDLACYHRLYNTNLTPYLMPSDELQNTHDDDDGHIGIEVEVPSEYRMGFGLWPLQGRILPQINENPYEWASLQSVLQYSSDSDNEKIYHYNETVTVNSRQILQYLDQKYRHSGYKNKYGTISNNYNDDGSDMGGETDDDHQNSILEHARAVMDATQLEMEDIADNMVNAMIREDIHETQTVAEIDLLDAQDDDDGDMGSNGGNGGSATCMMSNDEEEEEDEAVDEEAEEQIIEGSAASLFSTEVKEQLGSTVDSGETHIIEGLIRDVQDIDETDIQSAIDNAESYRNERILRSMKMNVMADNESLKEHPIDEAVMSCILQRFRDKETASLQRQIYIEDVKAAKRMYVNIENHSKDQNDENRAFLTTCLTTPLSELVPLLPRSLFLIEPSMVIKTDIERIRVPLLVVCGRATGNENITVLSRDNNDDNNDADITTNSSKASRFHALLSHSSNAASIVDYCIREYIGVSSHTMDDGNADSTSSEWCLSPLCSDDLHAAREAVVIGSAWMDVHSRKCVSRPGAATPPIAEEDCNNQQKEKKDDKSMVGVDLGYYDSGDGLAQTKYDTPYSICSVKEMAAQLAKKGENAIDKVKTNKANECIDQRNDELYRTNLIATYLHNDATLYRDDPGEDWDYMQSV